MSARSFGQGEIRSLTGLRGVAAILVMLYHFSFSMPAGTFPMAVFFHNGYLWVDLFFVLSGFVMAYSQTRLFAGGYRLRTHATFLLSRITRIYPLYVVVIVESACLLVWRTPHLDAWPFARTVLLNLSMTQAWGLAPSLEGAAWSISTEWGAYLLFPLLLAVTVSGSRRVAFATATLAMLAIIFLAVSPGPFAYPDQNRTGPLDLYSAATVAPLVRCIAEFSLGLVVFRIARYLAGRRPGWAGPGAIATVVLLFVALSWPGWDVLVVVLFSVLIMSLATRTGLVDRCLGAAIPYRLGQWSYSIYLIHDKFSHLAGLLRDRLSGHVPIASVVATALTSAVVIGCGAMTFTVVERPLRRLMKHALRGPSGIGAKPASAPVTSPSGADVDTTGGVETGHQWADGRDGMSGSRASAGWFSGPIWRAPGKFGRRDLGLTCAVLALAGAVFVASAAAADSLPWAPLVPLGLVAAGLAAWLVLAAVYGSPIAIMLYFAAVAFMTDAQFRVRGAGDIQADWQSALKFLIWLGAGVIGFAHMPPLREMLRRPGSACWLAYIVIAISSSLYSPVPGYSFGCALALLCLFAFSYSLTTRLSESQILWTLLLTLTVFNIGGWFVFYAIPDLGTSAAWTTSGLLLRMCGLAGQATNLGAICAKGVGAAFILWYTRRCGAVAGLVLGGFAFLTLLKSDARTTEIATVVGIAVILAARSVWLVAGGALAGICAVMLLQVFPDIMSMLGSSFSRSGDPTEVYTLTGRLQIWDFAWQQIQLNPVFGFGYNSSKSVLGGHIGFENGLMVDSAHNLYLQNMLSVGILGMIPLVTLLSYLTFRCCVRPIPIVSYMLVLVLVSSISDTDSIGTTPTLMTVLFFVVSVWPGLNEPLPVTRRSGRLHAVPVEQGMAVAPSPAVPAT